MNLNLEIFKLINGLAYKNQMIDNIMVVFSKYVPEFFMGSIAILYFYGFYKKNEKIRTIAVATIFLTILNLIFSFIIGIIYYEPRPFVTNKVNLLFPHVADASFPSDHATGTMSIAVGMNKYKRVYGIFYIVLSFIVGISRVYVGHHYPLDVIGGYSLVFITNLLFGKIIKVKVGELYLKIENKLLDGKLLSQGK